MFVAAERLSSAAAEPNKSAGGARAAPSIGCQLQRSLDRFRVSRTVSLTNQQYLLVLGCHSVALRVLVDVPELDITLRMQFQKV